MFPSIKRLVPQVASRHIENSVFSHISRAGSEIALNNQPCDLEGLVRVASAMQSFRYPAFNSAMNRTLLRQCEKEWIEKLVSDAELCSPATALRYIKTLSALEIPRDLLVVLLRKISVSSRQDIDEFLSVLVELDPARISGDMRNAIHYVVKNAVRSNLPLATYNSIFEIVNRSWESSRRHLLQTKMRQDLVASGWTAFLSLDMAREDDFVEAVKWLSHGEPPVGRKEDVDAMLSRVEMRAKGYIYHDKLAPMISCILSSRKPLIAEPLDSISQFLVKKMNVSRLSVTDLIGLVQALASFASAASRPVQLDTVATCILPAVLESVVKNLTLIPSRALPAVLRLVASSGSSNSESLIIEDCLKDRGHELDGVELVRLVNAGGDAISGDLVQKLFAVRLGEEMDHLSNLLSKLTVKEKAEFLAILGVGGAKCQLLQSSVIESLKLDLAGMKSEDELTSLLEADTIVKMFSAGDVVFEPTGIFPSKSLKAFLESDRSGSLSVYNSLKLLRVTTDVGIAKALFSHVSRAGNHLTVFESLELLNAAVSTIQDDPSFIDSALKLVVPAIDAGTEGIDSILRMIPEINPAKGNNWSSTYAPLTQLQRVVLGKIDLSSTRSLSGLKSVLGCINEMARLGFTSSQTVTEKLVDAALNNASSSEVVDLPIIDFIETVKSMRKLRVYNSEFLDLLSDLFLGRGSPGIADMARELTDMGNKNEAVLRASEIVLKSLAREDDDEKCLHSKISILNTMAKAGVYSPLFHEQLRTVTDQAASHVASLSDTDWIRLFEINLALLVEAPPRVKAKYANDIRLKNFFEDHCSFSWYANQERARTQFIHSLAREQLTEAASSLGWNLRVPELGHEVYHIDLVLASDEEKLAVITVPEKDELIAKGGIKVIVGSSMSKIKHLQLFGYKVVPVWMAEWNQLSCGDDRKQCLLRNSSQVVFTLGAAPRT